MLVAKQLSKHCTPVKTPTIFVEHFCRPISPYSFLGCSIFSTPSAGPSEGAKALSKPSKMTSLKMFQRRFSKTQQYTQPYVIYSKIHVLRFCGKTPNLDRFHSTAKSLHWHRVALPARAPGRGGCLNKWRRPDKEMAPLGIDPTTDGVVLCSVYVFFRFLHGMHRTSSPQKLNSTCFHKVRVCVCMYIYTYIYINK